MNHRPRHLWLDEAATERLSADLEILVGSARRSGADGDAPAWLPNPYEQLKALTRGQGITETSMRGFIASLELPTDAKQRLLDMTPSTYTGLAARLAREI